MTLLSLDLETSVKNIKIGKSKANPFHKENNIVAHGFKKSNHDVITFYKNSPNYVDILSDVSIMAAHNINFDFKYLLRYNYDTVINWVKNGGTIWCTMVAEYLLWGQTKQFPSLDETTKRYGGTLKDEKIKGYWNSGMDTEDIPEDELIEYLIADVENVEINYEAQVKLAKKLGLYAVIKLHMEALLTTTLMEFNGCKFDLEYAKREMETGQVELDSTKGRLENSMSHYFDTDYKVNVGSGDQLSLVLFGGGYKYTTKELMLDPKTNSIIKFKSGLKKGMPKYRNKLNEAVTRGYGYSPRDSWKVKKEGFFQTNDDVLKAVLNSTDDSKLKEFVTLLLKFRTLTKDLNTYFIGYSNLVWEDGYIHHQLNHCVTATGRLSSSNPNMQNLSN